MPFARLCTYGYILKSGGMYALQETQGTRFFRFVSDRTLITRSPAHLSLFHKFAVGLHVHRAT